MYYLDKIEILKDIFNTKEIVLENRFISVKGNSYPIVDDVIILLDPSQYPPALRNRLDNDGKDIRTSSQHFSMEIQSSFGEEWQKYPKILPEHESEFQSYFDIVDIPALDNLRVCDLGCGIGRWSYFLIEKCKELILVDFSEAIFVARQNLIGTSNTLFFMGDLKSLPFRENFADFLFCLGVLHHLPSPALDEVRSLKKYSSRLLIYLYYALDNRPAYFSLLFRLIDRLRIIVSKNDNSFFRSSFTWIMAVTVYRPLVILGVLLSPFGLSERVPLYETYHGKTLERIRQDVFDRFFTVIEQRYSKKQILDFKDIFSRVIISEQLPYWHFLCEK